MADILIKGMALLEDGAYDYHLTIRSDGKVEGWQQVGCVETLFRRIQGLQGGNIMSEADVKRKYIRELEKNRIKVDVAMIKKEAGNVERRQNQADGR